MIVRSSALLSALLLGSTMAGCSSPSGASREQAQQPTAGDQGSTAGWRTAEPAGLDGSLDAMTREIIEGLDAEKKTRIAVVGFTDESGAPSRFGLFLAEELTTRLFKAKRFTVIERGMLQKILDEQKLQVGTSLIDPKSAKEIGRILAVDALATGTYTLLGDRIKVNARLIGTQDGGVFAAAGGSVPCDPTIAGLVGGGCTSNVRSPSPTAGAGSNQPRADIETKREGVLKFEFFNLPPWTEKAVPSLVGLTPDKIEYRDILNSDCLGGRNRGPPSSGISGEWFAIRITGEINAERRGSYRFKTLTSSSIFTYDDLVYAEFGSSTLNGSSPVQSNESTVFVSSPGWVRLKLVDFHSERWFCFGLHWVAPGDTDWGPIPSAVMRASAQ